MSALRSLYTVPTPTLTISNCESYPGGGIHTEIRRNIVTPLVRTYSLTDTRYQYSDPIYKTIEDPSSVPIESGQSIKTYFGVQQYG